MTTSTGRFDGRVRLYARYRPAYPPGVVQLLRAECGLTAGSVVADIGSGTGILSAPLLDQGCRVIGVEPNVEMRAAAERSLEGHACFRSVAGTAEATGLDDASVDVVCAAQAFHWFDAPRARREFRRILKPRGAVALIWNRRRTSATPFAAAYEELLRTWGTDYGAVDHTRIGKTELASFFGTDAVSYARYDNRQRLDLRGFKGRAFSSSYTPPPGHPSHEPMHRALDGLFRVHQVEGRVSLEYDTEVYYGSLSGDD